MVKREDIKTRKDAILAIAIKRYIEIITPVSSCYIAEKYPSDVSSATIRNVLAELEEEGFLTHPHTSAGRMPTQKGYRYYVDNLMKEIDLLEREKKRIRNEYKKQSFELEDLLEKTSRIISNVTQCTGLVSLEKDGSKLFCCGTNYVVNYPDTQDLKKIEDILVALDEKQEMLNIINRNLDKKVEILIGCETACRKIETCSLVVSKYQTSKGIKGRVAVLGPTRMNYQKVVPTIEYLINILEEM